MKKYLALFLSFIILSSAALIGVQVYAAGSSDDVVYTEHTIAGDKSEIDGIQLELELQCAKHLFWDVDLTLGEEIECDTKFSHIYNYDPPVSQGRQEFELSFGLNSFGSSSSGGDLLDHDDGFFGQRDMILDVASRTPAGEKHTETVRIADYYEYYPLYASVHIGDLWFDTDRDHASSDRKYGAQMEKLQSVLDETFRIPVLADDLREISVTKRQDGTVSEVYSSEPDKPRTYLFSYAAIADDAVYFTVLPIVEGDSAEVLDVSQIRGGWGIYKFPYAITDYDAPYYAESNTMILFDTEKLSRVYPLEEGVIIEDFVLSEDASEFYLTTRRTKGDKDEIVLTVLDRETMSEKQSTVLFTCGADEYVHVHSYHDDFILYKIAYKKFAVIEKADGIWQTAFVVEDETITTYWSEQEYVTFSYGTMAEYDGERLAIVGFSNERGGMKSSGWDREMSYLSSVYLSVYSEKGNLYTGKFVSSLDTGTFLQYNNICKPVDSSSPIVKLP